MCEQNNDLTFMSIPEGKCMRNCVVKLNNLTPAINRKLMGSSMMESAQEYLDYKLSKGYKEPNLKINV